MSFAASSYQCRIRQAISNPYLRHRHLNTFKRRLKKHHLAVTEVHIPDTEVDEAAPSTSCQAAHVPVVLKSRKLHRHVDQEQVLIHRRAKTAQVQGKLHEALSILHKGLELYPEDLHFISLAASLESKVGNHAHALHMLNEALRKHKNHTALLATAGVVHSRMGKAAEAKEYFRRAQQRQQRPSPVILHMSSELEAKFGTPRAARDMLSRLQLAEGHAPHLYSSWARMEARMGDEQRARELFQEGAQECPDHAPLLHAWAVFEAGQGRLSAARKLLGDALDCSQGHLPSWMALGKVEWMTGDCEKARKVWSAGNSMAGPYAPLLNLWARYEMKSGGAAARTKAKELLIQALQADPDHAPSQQALVTLEDRAGGVDQASELYRMYLQGAFLRHLWQENRGGGTKGSAWPASHDHIFKGREAGEKKDSLIEQQNEGVSLEQNSLSAGTAASNGSNSIRSKVSPQVLHSWAQHLLKQGDHAGAHQALDRLEQLDPGNPHGCHSKGVLAVQQGQLEEAQQWYCRGLGRKGAPGSCAGVLLCLEALAELLAFKGDQAGARATFEEGLKAYPQPTPRYLRQYALLEKRVGGYELASDLYCRAARIQPRDPKTWLQWGALERRRKRFDAAEDCFRRGVAAAPSHPHLWYAYITMMWRLGKVQEARSLFEDALKLCPRNPPLYMEWALMEWSQGEVEAARKLFRKGIAVPIVYQHPPLYEAWSRLEAEAGNVDLAKKLTAQGHLLDTQKRSLRGNKAVRNTISRRADIPITNDQS
ncbi:hypothetical protein CEUSTIGMA_g4176.t1 [Chlamydomonas eustigma]|uniref:Uncharacterized protein n=1 Tax=Chlamydomonas eustigma TaxID=1157962 RepID=A0A250X1B8_9CHLO|nr:hypothetical protein CEUSTIGMA_g4176.t1 [Chlamydomonas eustigma]|eukprot:GAX76729.1 hypothetical protein CEUSTIGMA_g4176.t1 [Chlamydomonas eustigma]